MRGLLFMLIFVATFALAQAKEQEVRASRATTASSSSVQSSGELVVTPARQAPSSSLSVDVLERRRSDMRFLEIEQRVDCLLEP
jgi:hypothetical protein